MYLQVYFEDKSFDPTNYEKPFTPFLRNLYWLIGSHVWKNTHLYLKEVEILTDSGAISTDYSSENEIKYDTSDADMMVNFGSLETTDRLFVLNLYCSEKKDTYKRVYDKIQNILAQVGGVSKIILGLGLILSNFYNSYAYVLKMIRHNFECNSNNGKKVELGKENPMVFEMAEIIENAELYVSRKPPNLSNVKENQSPDTHKIRKTSTFLKIYQKDSGRLLNDNLEQQSQTPTPFLNPDITQNQSSQPMKEYDQSPLKSPENQEKSILPSMEEPEDSLKREQKIIVQMPLNLKMTNDEKASPVFSPGMKQSDNKQLWTKAI